MIADQTHWCMYKYADLGAIVYFMVIRNVNDHLFIILYRACND